MQSRFLLFHIFEIVSFIMELWNRSITLFLLDRVDCDIVG